MSDEGLATEAGWQDFPNLVTAFDDSNILQTVHESIDISVEGVPPGIDNRALSLEGGIKEIDIISFQLRWRAVPITDVVVSRGALRSLLARRAR